MPNGSVRMPVTMTRSGVFKYQDSMTGKVIYELRPDEEVFKADSSNTAVSLPVTDDHPPEMINPDNYKMYMKGLTDPEVKKDGQFMKSGMTIIDKDLLNKIKSGKRQLSLGYTVEVEDSPGVWNGIKYDKVQKNIKYNHLSVVDVARAGSQVRIDSEDIPILEYEEIKKDSKGGNMIKLDVNGVTYELDDKFASLAHAVTEKIKNDSVEINKLKAEAEKVPAIVKEKETIQGKYDALEAEKVKLDSQLKDIELTQLKEQAKQYLAKDVKLDGLDFVAIKEMVIKTKTPEFKADGKSIDYVNAFYDAVIQMPVAKEPKIDSWFHGAKKEDQKTDSSDSEVISFSNAAKFLSEKESKKEIFGYGGKN